MTGIGTMKKIPMNLPRRRVRLLLQPDGLQIASIRWRMETARHPGFLTDCKAYDPCVYCGGRANTWEHIQPRVLGGAESWENLSRACLKCNNKRGHMPFLLFVLARHNACSLL